MRTYIVRACLSPKGKTPLLPSLAKSPLHYKKLLECFNKDGLCLADEDECNEMCDLLCDAGFIVCGSIASKRVPNVF